MVLSGDTTYCENLVRHAEGCDLLINSIAAASEQQLAANEITKRLMQNYTSPEQLARICEEAAPKLTLIHHVSAWRVTDFDILARVRAGTRAAVEMSHDRMEALVGPEIRLFPAGFPVGEEALITGDAGRERA